MLYPEYQDIMSIIQMEKNRIPFYITYNDVFTRVKLHHHDFAELTIVTKGTGQEILNGKPCDLASGSVSFLLPNHVHEVICDDPNNPLGLYCMMFDLHLLNHIPFGHEIGNLLLQTGKALPSHVQLDQPQHQKMLELYNELNHEYTHDDLCKSASIMSKLTEALLLFVRARSNVETKEEVNYRAMKHPVFWSILNELQTNAFESISLQQISDKFNVSSSYVNKLFKHYLGHTFVSYLQMLRIRRAAALLATTDMNINEISVEVGFESFRTFSRVFKNTTGMTPSEYRNNLRHSAVR